MQWEVSLYCQGCKNSTAHTIRLIERVNGFWHLSATCQVDGCAKHYTDWLCKSEFLALLEARIGNIKK